MVLHHQRLLLDVPGFVLGNGTSRLEIQAKNLLTIGTVYGCNAQYREFSPHYLVAVDTKMINEIIDSGYHNDHEVWTNPNRKIISTTNINFFQPSKGWSSGPTALWLAATKFHKEIYILGFDFQGTNNLVNNVYAGTKNYKLKTDRATYYGNWLNQTYRVIKEFPDTKFIRIENSTGFFPEKLETIKTNFQQIDYEEFKKRFPAVIIS